RRLRQDNSVARQRLVNEASPGVDALDALDGVARGQGGEGRAVCASRVDGASDEIGGRERPRRIVNDEDLAVRRCRLDRVRPRVLTRGAALNDAERLGRAAQIGWSLGDEVGR